MALRLLLDRPRFLWDALGRQEALAVRPPSPRAAAGPVPRTGIAMPPLRVLVVDDDRDCADSLALLTGLWGYETRVAYDGPSALRLAAECRPDVVVLDVAMPEMDRFRLARRLRQTGPGRPFL